MGGQEFDGYVWPQLAISEIRVYAGTYVEAIQIIFDDGEGVRHAPPRVGGETGELVVFTLDKDEYVTGISGANGWYVDHIVIHTNKRDSDPIGGQGGEETFAFHAPEGHCVCGFFGRAQDYVDAIGILVEPIDKPAKPKAKPKKKKPASKPKAEVEAIVVEDEPIVVEAEAVAKPKAKKKKKMAPGKDLQLVEGIGPKISQLLMADGIMNLTDLAKAKVKTIQAILDKAGSRYRIADPTTWPEQAKLGAKGDMEGMKALQDELKGGRRV